ncbi:hypothetical protein HLH26_19305 [Gluconacetobacter sp. 1b LMG 1731]|uniref:Uncharacterized protein n=1 Tax=Gluconacetobacter dulcium TaxID=2729096 RepID=A0A7W4PHW4_9PROT|nr:hypothetical protein [Gluconacetobacter dulcium]MBB2166632.1 hypothetical protein [Gluconacetobacter dulcium]MBB2195734.1 hypothetical protein [Gluconacetobacter dulcium]MBB2198592.1 hypothetical protein [Gluconacetobacter dulcium]
MTDSFDDVAALIREAEAERDRFLDRFAHLCEQALPRQTTVSRSRRGLFRKTETIDGLAVRLGTQAFHLARAAGQIEASIVHEVRGVTLSRRTVHLREWITTLVGQVQALGGAVSGEGAALAHATRWSG